MPGNAGRGRLPPRQGGLGPVPEEHCDPDPQLTTLPQPSGWRPHASLHGFTGTHALQAPQSIVLPHPSSCVPHAPAAHGFVGTQAPQVQVEGLHVVAPGHGQSRFPPQPSGPPHAVAGREAQVLGVQQVPSKHSWPLWQSPQCCVSPHEETSPQ
jgi:hypothetical protein